MKVNPIRDFVKEPLRDNMIEFIEVELHVTFNLTFHTNKIHVSNGLIYISFSLHLQLGLQHIHLENDNTQLNARKIIRQERPTNMG